MFCPLMQNTMEIEELLTAGKNSRWLCNYSSDIWLYKSNKTLQKSFYLKLAVVFQSCTYTGHIVLVLLVEKQYCIWVQFNSNALSIAYMCLFHWGTVTADICDIWKHSKSCFRFTHGQIYGHPTLSRFNKLWSLSVWESGLHLTIFQKIILLYISQ